MIKLIVSDIDGTLVPDGSGEGSLNPEYFDVIRDLYNRGIRFAACSGRQYPSIYKVFRPVADIIHFICEGGGLVSNGKREMLHCTPLAPDMVREMIQDAMRIPEIDFMVAGARCTYCRYEDSELYRWVVEDYGFDMEAVGDMSHGVDDDVLKVALYHPEAVEELTKEWFRPKWSKLAKTNMAGKQWLDIVSKESGKGHALDFLQQYLGILPEETIVFGDNENDTEMIEHSSKFYVVGSAAPKIKEYADEVCPPMPEDGVLQVLKKI